MAFGQVNKTVNYTWRFKDADIAAKAMQNIQRVAVGASTAIVAGMTAIAVSSVKAASEFVEIENQFNVVFGDAAPRARAELDAFADSIGRSGNRMVGFAATIQDTLVPLGMARDQAAGLSTEVVRLATDLSSFKNLDLEETINRISSGLVGQHRSVQRLGIIINQTTLSQELMNMGIEGGVQAASESEKAFARLNLMYAASRDAMGDSVRTAGEFENQIRVLGDAWYDMRVEIGGKLIPILNELIPEAKEMIGDFGELAVAVLPPLLKGVIGIAKVGKNAIPIIAGITAAIIANAAATGGLSLAYTALQIKAMSLTGSMITLKGALGAAGLAGAIIFTADQLSKLNNAIDDAKDALTEQSEAEDILYNRTHALFVMNELQTNALETGTIPALEAQRDRLMWVTEQGIGVTSQLAVVNRTLAVLEIESRDAAIAQLELVMAMAELKGATPDVIAQLEREIAMLEKAQVVARTFRDLRKEDPTPVFGGRDEDPPFVKDLEQGLELANELRAAMVAIRQTELDRETKLTELALDRKHFEIEHVQRMNDMYMCTAHEFGRAMRNGGEDLLGIAVQIGIEFAKMQLGKAAAGGIFGGIFSFVGGFI